MFLACFAVRNVLNSGQNRGIISRRIGVLRAHFTDQWPERPFVYGVQ